MDTIFKYLRENFLDVEFINDNLMNIHLPMTYIGGDCLSIEIQKINDNFFNISDRGLSIDIIDNITIGSNTRQINSAYKSVFETIDLVKLCNDSNNIMKLVISKITLEELPTYIAYLSEKSIEFSNKLFELLYKNAESDLTDEVEEKLKYIFKADYKDKVKKDFHIIGDSSKNYKIPFVIVEKDKKKLIEIGTNHAVKISSIFTKYFDIGKHDNIMRGIIFKDIETIDASTITLLKNAADYINTVSNIEKLSS